LDLHGTYCVSDGVQKLDTFTTIDVFVVLHQPFFDIIMDAFKPVSLKNMFVVELVF
jgi:hypothetical protein